MKILDKLIQRTGKLGYSIDVSVSKRELLIFLFSKFIQASRGIYYKLFIKTDGLLFVGKKCSLKYIHKIKAGKTLTIGDYVEINALSKHGIIIGDNVSILKNSIIECTGVLRNIGEGLIIGNNVGIAQGCFIQVRGRVKIGDNVIFGPNVSVFSENHNFESIDVPIKDQGENRKGVEIEENVWIGTGAIILDGVKVGRGSIIAAGSIVNKDILPYSIAAGIPAKVIKTRV